MLLLQCHAYAQDCGSEFEPNLVREGDILRTQDWPVKFEAGSKPGFQKFISLSRFESYRPSGRERGISYSSFFAEASKYSNRENLCQYLRNIQICMFYCLSNMTTKCRRSPICGLILITARRWTALSDIECTEHCSDSALNKPCGQKVAMKKYFCGRSHAEPQELILYERSSSLPPGPQKLMTTR